MGAEGWAAVAAWVTLILGVWMTKRSLREARTQADDSKKVAEEANRTAARALELAESAEARADRLEQMAAERRDVQWDCHLNPDTGWLHVRNIGSDVAYDVEVIVEPAEAQASRRREVGAEVAPTQDLRVDVSDLYAASVSAASAKRAAGIWPRRAGVEVRTLRVSWRSAANVPDFEAWDDREFLGR